MISFKKRSRPNRRSSADFDVVDRVPIQVDIKRAAVAQQIADERETLRQPFQVRVERQVVAIGVYWPAPRAPFSGDAPGVDLAGAERRIEIDQLEVAGPVSGGLFEQGMVVGAIHIDGRRAVARQLCGQRDGDWRGIDFLNGESLCRFN